MRQRSQLWRQRQVSSGERHALLDAFDVQMALVSTRIHRRRQRALHRLEPIAQRWQAHLSGGTEALELHYKPGSKLDDLRAEFVRFVFSREGQEVVVKDGYLPVPAPVAREELKSVGIEPGF